MLRVAVCDDTPKECEAVIEYAARFFKEQRSGAEIDSYSSMEQLLKEERPYDLYLLDVLIPGINGIDGAACLKGRYENPVIVFITSSLESAVDGYRVNAAGFILKPVEKERFYETMERVVKQKLSACQETISVIHDRVTLELPLTKVLYFENRLHRVYAVLTQGEEYAIGQKLSVLEEELGQNECFLRCHQSFLVNLSHVTQLEDSCFLFDDGTRAPVSRSFYKHSKNVYYHYRLR